MHIGLSDKEADALLASTATPVSIVKQILDYRESLTDPMDNWFRQAAMERSKDGELEVDDGAIVSRGDDAGAYVQAWLWVDDCEHTWVDATNQAVQAGELCTKCGRLR